MKENTVAVCADFTHTFAYPKLGFMFAENYPYVGNWNYYDIGLDEGCWANEQFEYFAITDDILKYFPLNLTVVDYTLLSKKLKLLKLTQLYISSFFNLQ